MLSRHATVLSGLRVVLIPESYASDAADSPSESRAQLNDSMQPAISQAMLSACTEHIVVIGRDLKIYGASPAALTAWNIDSDSPGEWCLTELVGEKCFRDHLQKNIGGVLAGEIADINLSWSEERAHGEVENYRCFLSPVHGMEGRVDGVVMRLAELTERENIEKALAVTRQRLEDFTDATSDWQWEMDAQLRFSWVSSQITRFYGLDPDTYRGQPRKPLLQTSAEKDAWDKHCSLLERQQPFRDFEYRVQSATGVRWTRTCGVPKYDEDGEFCGYRGTGSDITGFRLVEQQASRAESRFLHVIDEFPGAFALFDESDQLVVYNQRYVQTHEILGEELVPGLSFERSLRIQLQNGYIPAAIGCEDQWLLERLEHFRNPVAPFEIKKGDGNWYRVTELRLPDGGCLKTMLDITVEKSNELLIKEERNLLRSLIDGIPHIIYAKDRDSRLTVLNKAGAEFLGRASTVVSEDQSYSHADYFSPQASARYREQDDRVIQSGEVVENFEHSVVRPSDGAAVWISTCKQPLRDTNGEIIGLVGAASDISIRKNVQVDLQCSEQRFRDFAESAADWFWEMDVECRICYLSERYEEITGTLAADFIGAGYRDLAENVMHGADAKMRFVEAIENQTAFFDLEAVIDGGEDGRRHFLVSGKPHNDDKGIFCGFRGVGRDITRFRQLERKLSHQALHDDLTGLPNRREFMLLLEIVVNESVANGNQSVLGYLDLDQFKVINDTVGHLAGDQLLIQVGSLIRSCLRKTDSLARLGGDEFGLLFHDTTIAEAELVVQRVISELESFRFQWQDKVFGVGGSAGLVAIDGSNSSSIELVAQADLACYSAKDSGRGGISFYNADNDELCRRRSQLLVASGITESIECDRFVLYAQPIAAVVNGKLQVRHYEILVRMVDEDEKLIFPGAFIPAAERFGLMDRIDRWVIARTLQQIDQVLESSDCDSITINLSGQSLSDSTLANYVKEQLDRNNIAASRICFEITETAAISNFEMAQNFIETLKNIGCRFALDDFGSGLSSFAYLKNLPVDYLKIDGSFVRDMVDDPTDRVMVSSIDQVGKLLGMKTIAEFVENEQTLYLLTDIGVDYVQGYFVGRPVEFVSPL